MFTVEERDRVRDHMLELARNDSRVVAGTERIPMFLFLRAIKP